MWAILFIIRHKQLSREYYCFGVFFRYKIWLSNALIIYYLSPKSLCSFQVKTKKQIYWLFKGLFKYDKKKGLFKCPDQLKWNDPGTFQLVISKLRIKAIPTTPLRYFYVYWDFLRQPISFDGFGFPTVEK